MTQDAKYPVPKGPLLLDRPVVRPAPGTLPLRGDLAHIALAGTYLAAHYVVPQTRKIASGGAVLHLVARADSEVVARLDEGSEFELLDPVGDWAWGCLGPQGPSGYLRMGELAPVGE